MRIRFARSIPFVSLLLLHCGDHPHPGDASDAAVDSGVDVPGVDMGIDQVTPPDDVPQDTGNDAVTPVDVIVDEDAPVDAPTGPTFCSMGGAAVPGAIVPSGFCLHQFAGHAMSSDANRIVGPRTMAFASNGDLFVAAPASGAPGGRAAAWGRSCCSPMRITTTRASCTSSLRAFPTCTDSRSPTTRSTSPPRTASGAPTTRRASKPRSRHHARASRCSIRRRVRCDGPMACSVRLAGISTSPPACTARRVPTRTSARSTRSPRADCDSSRKASATRCTGDVTSATKCAA